jgi:peptidyl-Lys metalloendopeptidase
VLMTRGHVGWVAVCCLSLGGGACTSRQSTEPAPTEQKAPEHQEKTPAMAETLECKMSVTPSAPSGKPVELRFALTNRTAAPLYVLKWHSPLEGIRSRDLDVTRDGVEVDYLGIMAKRSDPPADQYVTIAPGDSVEGRIDLTQGYAMTQPGRYRIEYSRSLMDVADKQSDVPRTFDNMKSLQVKCPVVETTITAP